MINSYRKHKILKVLDKHWKEGEAKTSNGWEVTDIGRTYTVNELTKITGINLQTIEDLCNSLTTSCHLKMVHYDKNGKAHRFVITHLGQSAYTDWYFPKEIVKGFAASLTAVLAIASFLWNVFSSQTLKDHSSRLRQLEMKQSKNTVTK